MPIEVNPRWLVAQVGAREHYAPARAFHARGHLERLYTDAWWPYGTFRAAPDFLRRLAGRCHPDLPAEKVTAFTRGCLRREFTRRLRQRVHRQRYDAAQESLRFNSWFAQKVARALRSHPLDPSRHAFFGFTLGALEPLTLCRDLGVPTVISQIDPDRVEHDLVQQEAQKWPGWERHAPAPHAMAELWQRRAAEREAASLVLVNSDWSRRAMLQLGVPEHKLIIVPLAYEPPATADSPRPRHDGPLTVLWLGSVILRKGIPYLFEAAKRLRGSGVRFVVAGPIGISDQAAASAPDNLALIGPVTRDRVGEMYRQAHLFVLPTVSDGFAITQLEAMAHGLPVIATYNCGDVVDDGVDGLRIPAADAEALAQAISRLNDDRQLLAEMSRHALEKSRQFTLERYARSVEAAVEQVRSTAPAEQAGAGG